ncbi:hypothetical protein CEN44_00425 [Fischerella muscicola CCMEE 5323]|uniref:Uncharacterized protein n=1 Tax=Fischerella muscicola CCMEE 5323 TaxID=2019572 RepID=A0A2N6K975_FISMU|nr:hypothetical protein CEN44_00425 [Fischerella muscicola CCMEE 5323]
MQNKIGDNIRNPRYCPCLFAGKVNQLGITKRMLTANNGIQAVNLSMQVAPMLGFRTGHEVGWVANELPLLALFQPPPSKLRMTVSVSRSFPVIITF